jgi:20S proteasome subunit beta 1
MAATFNGGVVLGADSRTSTGNYVANRVTDKLTQLTDKVLLSLLSLHDKVPFCRVSSACGCSSCGHNMVSVPEDNHICNIGINWRSGNNVFVLLQVFVCRSGSAADTQAISSYVQYYLHQHQMELDHEIHVKTAATFATKLVYSNKVHASAVL